MTKIYIIRLPNQPTGADLARWERKYGVERDPHLRHFPAGCPNWHGPSLEDAHVFIRGAARRFTGEQLEAFKATRPNWKWNILIIEEAQ